MSLNATLWAWSQKLTAPQKLILLSLADRAGENHEAWPSIARLELDTGLNRKTIMGHLQNLQEMGLITEIGKVGATQRVKKYQLNGVGERGEIVPNLEQSQKRNDPKNGTINSPKNGTIKQYQKRYSEPTTLFNLPLEPKEREVSEETTPAKDNKKFSVPSIDQMDEYKKEMGYTWQSKDMHDYYCANGWMVGRSKMKDWRAAMRSWDTREKKYCNKPQSQTKKRNSWDHEPGTYYDGPGRTYTAEESRQLELEAGF
jgi:hypothetical protein